MREHSTSGTLMYCSQRHDEWRLTRWRAWNEHFRLLRVRREAFNELAKPLEPYIFVFALFAAPAFVMSTPFCQDRSGANTVGTDGGNYAGDGTTNFTYVNHPPLSNAYNSLASAVK